MMLFLAAKSFWYHTDLPNAALLIHLSPGPPSMPQFVLAKVLTRQCNCLTCETAGLTTVNNSTCNGDKQKVPRMRVQCLVELQHWKEARERIQEDKRINTVKFSRTVLTFQALLWRRHMCGNAHGDMFLLGGKAEGWGRQRATPRGRFSDLRPLQSSYSFHPWSLLWKQTHQQLPPASHISLLPGHLSCSDEQKCLVSMALNNARLNAPLKPAQSRVQVPRQIDQPRYYPVGEIPSNDLTRVSTSSSENNKSHENKHVKTLGIQYARKRKLQSELSNTHMRYTSFALKEVQGGGGAPGEEVFRAPPGRELRKMPCMEENGHNSVQNLSREKRVRCVAGDCEDAALRGFVQHKPLDTGSTAIRRPYISQGTWIRCLSGQKQQGYEADWQICETVIREEKEKGKTSSKIFGLPAPSKHRDRKAAVWLHGKNQHPLTALTLLGKQASVFSFPNIAPKGWQKLRSPQHP
ncbi:hypothetical protein E5288_WYG013074 [Bos mutus]|uniref:Uncharacterized protein n=1 Tax=Bos mutus TaxID=72004 RepID=A0A6B0R8Q6_9CETA|nr:hypothetical protein [Bos mutus]